VSRIGGASIGPKGLALFPPARTSKRQKKPEQSDFVGPREVKKITISENEMAAFIAGHAKDDYYK
jgi:hypothetical protein